MAWIESHQSLLTHRKTLRAAALLKINRYQFIGHLHALWWWGLDNAESDGRLRGSLAEEVADAAGWTGKGDFADALVGAGFLDRDGDDFVIHEWYEFAGKLTAQRQIRKESNRKSSSAYRQRLRQQGVSADVHKNQQSTVQNSTEQNPTLPFKQQQERNAFAIYEKAFGSPIPNQVVVDKVIDAEHTYGTDCLIHSMEAAALANVRSWAYVERILERHEREGCEPLPKAVEDHWTASVAAQSELEQIWQEVDANA